MNGAHTIGFTIIREAKLRGGDVALKYSQAVCARAVQSTCLGPIVYYIPDVLFAEKVRRHESGSCQRPIVLSYLSCARTERCILPARLSSPRSFSSQIIRLKFRRRCLLEYFAVKEHSKIFIIRQKWCLKIIIDY